MNFDQHNFFTLSHLGHLGNKQQQQQDEDNRFKYQKELFCAMLPH